MTVAMADAQSKGTRAGGGAGVGRGGGWKEKNESARSGVGEMGMWGVGGQGCECTGGRDWLSNSLEEGEGRDGGGAGSVGGVGGEGVAPCVGEGGWGYGCVGLSDISCTSVCVVSVGCVGCVGCVVWVWVEGEMNSGGRMSGIAWGERNEAVPWKIRNIPRIADGR